MLDRQKLLLAAVALLWFGGAWPQDAASLRLGFLLNFMRYVDWPESHLKPGMPLRICLAPGDADMGSQFGEFGKQLIQGRSIEVKQLTRPAEASGCHVLYLPADTPGALPAWLGSAQQAGALTVSDLPDFIEAGGIIGLVSVGGHYRFDINLGVARKADLRLGSQLLKLAKTVR